MSVFLRQPRKPRDVIPWAIPTRLTPFPLPLSCPCLAPLFLSTLAPQSCALQFSKGLLVLSSSAGRLESERERKKSPRLSLSGPTARSPSRYRVSLVCHPVWVLLVKNSQKLVVISYRSHTRSPKKNVCRSLSQLSHEIPLPVARQGPSIRVLKGGCLGRGWFVFHTENHENHGTTRWNLKNNPFKNTNPSILKKQRESQKARDVFLIGTPLVIPPFACHRLKTGGV